MTATDKDRRKKHRKPSTDASGQLSGSGCSAKDYNYVFHITDDDIECLAQYRDMLASGSATFAEIFYNYLFDNPDIADVLYAYERNGGEVSELIRNELTFMLDLFNATNDDTFRGWRSNNMWRDTFNEQSGLPEPASVQLGLKLSF